jgi:hypothetical protein
MERVRRLLQHPDPDATRLVAVLSFAGCLPISQASAAAIVEPCPYRREQRPPHDRA